MRIGIVIPSYNQGTYLEAAIQSVVLNKQHADIKIAVVDGGSTDESVDIIKRHEDELDYWCSEKDEGQADAINKGILHLPDCQYYMWLNSDDVYEDEYAVHRILTFAETEHYEVCYGLSHYIDHEGKIIGEYPVEAYSKENLGKRCYLSQPSVLFSRKAYLACGPLNKNLMMCLDYEYWIRLSRQFEFGYLDQYIGSTRMYETTKTSTMQGQHLMEAIMILNHYYGDVPTDWLLTKFLADHPKGFWRVFPKKVLRPYIRCRKKSMIRNITDEDNHVKDNL